MLGRLAAVVISVLILFISAPAVSASSPGGGPADFKFNGSTASDNIWTGMCLGASLNLSQASQKSCERQLQNLKQQGLYPFDQPNIQASLCLGASLNLSRASAASCGRQTAASSAIAKKNRNTATATTQQATTTAQVQYAALGDSVAAGTGLQASTNSADRTCGRSPQAYPFFVAAARGLSFIHVACSGSIMGTLNTPQRGQPAQLESAFANGTPKLITITDGANSLRWNAVLMRCLRSTCGTPSDTRAMQGIIALVQSQTQGVLQNIVQRSGGSPPKVIITGYFNPLSANCSAVTPQFTNAELAWADSQLASLNQALQNATSGFNFATFVPIDFTGHDVCSSDPWVQGTNDPAPLHPTAAGQQAIAQMILDP